MKEEEKTTVVINSEEVVNNIKVGKKTAKYINLLSDLEEICNDMFDVVDEDFPNGDRIYDKEIYPSMAQVKVVLMRCLGESIQENLSRTNNVTII